MRWKTILMLVYLAGCLAPPLVAGDRSLAPAGTSLQIPYPAEVGELRGEVTMAASEPGARGIFSVDGSAEILEVATTPSETSLGTTQVDVRFGRLGSIRYVLTADGPVVVAADIRDCAAIAELAVMRAAAGAVRANAERLARADSSADPESGALAAGSALAALAVLAPTLVDDCRDIADPLIVWRCIDSEWEEDCGECCHRGRMVTDVGAVFCGAVGAMFCAPSVAGVGLCAGVAAVTCQRIGELAERGCVETCSRLPRKPREGERCGLANRGICSDTCSGTILAGSCATGLVCCQGGAGSTASFD